MELSGRSDMAGYKKIKGVPRKEALGMDEIIPMFIRSMKLSAGHNTQRVFAAWDAVSGVPTYSLRKFFRDGKLYVTLSSSMVRSHLEFQKPALIQAINSYLLKDDLFIKEGEGKEFVKEIILK